MSRDGVMEKFTMLFGRGVTGADDPGVFLCNPRMILFFGF